MNKVLVVSVVLIAIGVVSEAKAQTTFMASSQLPESAQRNVQPETGKRLIRADELPKAVKHSLKKSILKDWEISEAYIVSATVLQADPKAVYEVYLVNANHKRTVARFYENGKVVSGKN